jgi:NADH:ubiquinone oxidoreductase subunit 3 (subunit A)
LASQNHRGEKLSSYECGFDPFHDSRQIFDVRFYLVGILFLLFDVEATFLFPWAVTLSQNQAFGFWTIVDFLFELFVGFIYLWNLGCLDRISLKH